MLTTTNIVAPIIQLFIEKSDSVPVQIGRDSKLSDFGFDSLDLIDLIMALEKEFKIDFYGDDKTGMLISTETTVGEIIELVRQKIG